MTFLLWQKKKKMEKFENIKFNETGSFKTLKISGMCRVVEFPDISCCRIFHSKKNQNFRLMLVNDQIVRTDQNWTRSVVFSDEIKFVWHGKHAIY